MFKNFFKKRKFGEDSVIDPAKLAEQLYPTGTPGKDYHLKSLGAVAPVNVESSAKSEGANAVDVSADENGGKARQGTSDSLQGQDSCFVDYLYGGFNPVENGVRVVLKGRGAVEVSDARSLNDYLDYKRLMPEKKAPVNKEERCASAIGDELTEDFDKNGVADVDEFVDELRIVEDDDATPHRDLVVVDDAFDGELGEVGELEACETLYLANLRQIHDLMYEDVQFENWPKLWCLCFCGLEEVRDFYFDVDFLVEEILRLRSSAEAVRILKLEILHLLLKADEVIFEACASF